MIDRVGHEVRRHLQEHIGRPQASIRQLAAQFAGRLGDVGELARRPAVRTALEQADVHAVEFQRRDQVEHVIVRQQRKREIGAGQFECHSGS